MSRIFISEQELIDRLGLNDTEAFEELYHRYWFSLYKYCLKKLHSTEESRRIVRTVFIDIWSKRSELPVSFSLQQYLYLEVRSMVVRALCDKLANATDMTQLEKRWSHEFSWEFLQAATQPVRRCYENKRPVRKTDFTYTEKALHKLENIKFLFQSMSTRLSFIHSTYTKN